MRASANLRNWLAFLTLRSDAVPSGRFAQWEIRQFANVVADLVKVAFPRTYDLFVARK
jgi:thymidylate synthase ThyX